MHAQHAHQLHRTSANCSTALVGSHQSVQVLCKALKRTKASASAAKLSGGLRTYRLSCFRRCLNSTMAHVDHRLPPALSKKDGGTVSKRLEDGELSLHPNGNQRPHQERHLIVMVNGLYGKASNWDAAVECLTERLSVQGKRETLVYASSASTSRQTFEGVDSCGLRLAEEIRQLRSDHPSLCRISLVGHSMGGLIARHAAGLLLVGADIEAADTDIARQSGGRSSCLMAGMEPAHFITMATPHLGCSVSPGLSQLPFLQWMEHFPRICSMIAKAVPWVTQWLYARVGSQFFLADGSDDAGDGDDNRKEPLLVRKHAV